MATNAETRGVEVDGSPKGKNVPVAAAIGGDQTVETTKFHAEVTNK